ncbi:unnamed protein product [Closterium sp. Naga37s-1]|nr:unnamed protein product [Closterium sp. Naga37s-1]
MPLLLDTSYRRFRLHSVSSPFTHSVDVPSPLSPYSFHLHSVSSLPYSFRLSPLPSPPLSPHSSHPPFPSRLLIAPDAPPSEFETSHKFPLPPPPPIQPRARLFVLVVQRLVVTSAAAVQTAAVPAWTAAGGSRFKRAYWHACTNVERLLKVCRRVGLRDVPLFTSTDLVDGRDAQRVSAGGSEGRIALHLAGPRGWQGRSRVVPAHACLVDGRGIRDFDGIMVTASSAARQRLISSSSFTSSF